MDTSGGLIGRVDWKRKQVGTLGAQLPLTASRQRLVLRPLAHGPAADSEEPSQIGIQFAVESGLGRALGDLHVGQSRPLDWGSVKHSRHFPAYRSSPMDTFGGRLQQALDVREETNIDAFADRAGISRANIYLYLAGTTKLENVRGSSIDKLCKALRVRREWLVDGSKPMDREVETEETWGNVLGYAQAVGLGRGAEAQEYAETHKLKFRADSLARKRLTPSSLAVMYGSGDSMLPRIHQGDAVLFDTHDTQPRDGALFVVQWKGEYYVKRAAVFDEDVFFAADNPAGDHNWRKPKRMDAKRDPITIIGRVRWIGSWED